MPTNSRAKGARIEREAANLLCSLGFDCERNARNGKSTADIDLSRDPVLSKLHIEVKGNEAMDLVGKFRDETFAQAERDAHGKPWSVLWRRKRRPWVLTWKEGGAVLHTTDIKWAITTITERTTNGN